MHIWYSNQKWKGNETKGDQKPKQSQSGNYGFSFRSETANRSEAKVGTEAKVQLQHSPRHGKCKHTENDFAKAGLNGKELDVHLDRKWAILMILSSDHFQCACIFRALASAANVA